MRTPITAWLVLASVTAIKTKRRPRSFDFFLEAVIIPGELPRGFCSSSRVVVRLLGLALFWPPFLAIHHNLWYQQLQLAAAIAKASYSLFSRLGARATTAPVLNMR